MMRIGIEAQRIFRENPHGMDVFAINLINELAVLEGVSKIFVFINADEVKPGIIHAHDRVELVLFSGQYAYWEQVLLPKKVKEYRLDCMHFTSNTRSVRMSVPVITTLHDVFFLDSHPLLSSGFTAYQGFGNLYRRWLVNFLGKRNKYVTVSNSEAERIKSKHGFKSVEVVYNGCADRFAPVEGEELQSVLEQFKIDSPYIFFFGNTDPKKNTKRTFRACVEVLKSHPNQKLVIADYYDYRSLLLEEVDDEDVIARIQFLGYIPQENMPAVYSGASVFVYASLFESFGLPQIEAMRCGVPVVAGNCGAMLEVTEQKAVHVDPTDVKALTEAIDKILNEPVYASNLVKAAYSVAAKYSWTNTAKSYLTLYKQLV